MIIGDPSLAVEYIKKGEIIAYPTEAVYGIGCDPWNQKSVEKIYKIKKRVSNKPFILVASDINHLNNLINIGSLTDDVLSSWPGHVTWLIPALSEAPQWLIDGSTGLIAIRISNHKIIKQICSIFGKPIISTSANMSSEKPFISKEDMTKNFSSSVPLLVEGEIGSYPNTSIIKNMLTGEKIR